MAFTNVPVPAELTIKTSTIPDAGLGVFAKQFIPKSVKVGPYEGRRVLKDEMEYLDDTSYIWEVSSYSEMGNFCFSLLSLGAKFLFTCNYVSDDHYLPILATIKKKLGPVKI